MKKIRLKVCYCLLFTFTLTSFAFSQTDTTKNIELDEVVVMGKSKVREINESAYNVVSIDTRLLHNTTLSLTQTLDRISGVKIRETGGVGSSAQISLNGFSGRHIKVFMDG
ncbi:MAG: TonB-dependent receptor plug domain-containing protein, partial [Prevotellaceae bacterium]|nr:TonB-dependent receptor plug domain-containing protein [Prevotellaceae bacterium]